MPLKQIRLFDGLDDERLAHIEAITGRRSLSTGEMLFHAGDDATGFYGVVSGRIKLSKLSPDGKEQILHIMGPGDTIGEVPVFAGNRFPGTAEALEHSDLLYLPVERFRALMAADPMLAGNMTTVLARRLLTITGLVENLTLRDVPGRLAAYLVDLHHRTGGPDIALDIPKGQLAVLLGTTPESVSRAFARLRDDSLISMTGKQLTILDPGGLAEMAGIAGSV